MYSYSPFDFQDYDYLSALFCHNNFENDNNSLNTPLILSPANNVSENVLQSPSTCLNLFEPIATPISQTIGTVGPSLASRSMKSSPYPPIRMIGSIAEHDRPYAVYGQLSHARIARQCCFDLTGFKTKRRRLFDNKRMSRQTYAIMCTTSITKEHVMSEICHQFPMEILQYACVSIGESQSPGILYTMYIQIILRRVINKRHWFLDQVTGDHCNYHVTDNDLAWNEYIKKDHIFMEFGLFKSKMVRTQAGNWPSDTSICVTR